MREGLGRALLLVLLTAGLLVPGTAAASSHEPPPILDATAWVLIDAESGERLAERGAEWPLPVASATKLMTVWVALRRLEFSDVVRAADYRAAPVESVLGLAPGQFVTVRDLVDAMILVSGNDAAVTLAVAAAGSVPAFVRLMNLAAVEMGLDQSRFSNPIGLDEPGNRSSADDLAELGRRLMSIPRFREIAGATTSTLRSLDPPREIETRNTLLHELPWADGIKTGHTLQAGYVLVGSGTRAGVNLISVVLGAPSMPARDVESRRLLEYGMSLYRWRAPVRRGRALAAPEIRFGGGRLGLRPARTVRAAVRADQDVEIRIRAPETVEGPIARGTPLGAAVVSVDGEIRDRVRLRADRDVPEAGVLRKLSQSPWALSAASVGLLFVILIAAALIRRRNRRETDEDWMSFSTGTSQGGGGDSDRNGER